MGRHRWVSFDDERWAEAKAFIDQHLEAFQATARMRFGQEWQERLGHAYEAAIRIARAFRLDLPPGPDRDRLRMGYVSTYLRSRTMDLAYGHRRRRLRSPQPEDAQAMGDADLQVRARDGHPLAEAMAAEGWAWLLRGLSAIERSVIEQRYLGGLKLAAIAKELGVTESRACQLHASALRVARVRLRLRGDHV